MAKFNELSINDLREFIGLLTGDDYYPEQLFDFDAVTLQEAIEYLKAYNIDINANNIYKQSATIEISKLYNRLNDINDFELPDMDITPEERASIEKFMAHIDVLLNPDYQNEECMFDICANGTQDSQVTLISDNLTDTDKEAIYILNKETECFSEFQEKLGGYVPELEELVDEHKTIDTVEDFKKYFESMGWNVTGDIPKNNFISWDISQQSPAGEDYYFNIYCEATPKAICKEMFEIINSFDVNEHAMMWAESAGMNGVPPLDVLIEDAKDIQNMLVSLQDNRPPVKGWDYDQEHTKDEPDICE